MVHLRPPPPFHGQYPWVPLLQLPTRLHLHGRRRFHGPRFHPLRPHHPHHLLPHRPRMVRRPHAHLRHGRPPLRLRYRQRSPPHERPQPHAGRHQPLLPSPHPPRLLQTQRRPHHLCRHPRHRRHCSAPRPRR